MRELIERLEKATGPDRDLDIALWRRFCPEAADVEARGKIPLPWLHCYTASIDAAVALAERVLLGWTWRVASCHVSDDAWVIPDFNHPVHGERLMREYGQVEGDPATYWQEITDVDLRPSGRPAIALCLALLRAKEQETR